MGFFQDLYYKLENGYYSILDRIDKAGIHIYKVIDPIDKVIPSFVIVLIILAIIILGLVYYFAFAMGINAPGQDVTFMFVDKLGNPVTNAQVEFALNGADSLNATTTPLGTISFSANPGDKVNLTVTSGEDSEDLEAEITDELEYRFSLQFALAKDTVNFSVYSSDAQPMKTYNIDFFCSNPNANSPDSITNTTSSAFTIELDPECGNLSADFKSGDYEEEIIDSLVDGTNVILRPYTFSGNGSVVIGVYDSVDKSPISDFTATLSQNGLPIQQKSLGNNYVTFAGLANTTYSLSITKLGYLQKTQEVVINNVTSITVNLEKDLAGTSGALNVTVVDKSGNKLSGALVTVYNTENGQQTTMVSSKTTANDGTASFAVSDVSKKYWVLASKSGYVSISKKDVLGNANVLVTMYSTSNVRYTRIRVIDDQNMPVNNATVALYDEQDNVVVTKFGLTKLDGMAEGNLSEDGAKYKAYVYKGAYSGLGPVFTVDLSRDKDEIDSTVVLVLPRSSWEITLKDVYGQPIPNALVKLYDAYNESPLDVGAKYASPQGLFSATNLRADKKYFVVVTADSFENYISISKYLTPNASVSDTFIMEKQRLNTNPVIEYLGIEDLEGKQAIKLGPNNMYKVKFKITLPNGDNINTGDDGEEITRVYNNLYSLFYVGKETDEESIIEKEFAYIDRVEISGNATMVKGRAYYKDDFTSSIGETRKNNDEVREGTPFEDQIKWVQLEWNLDQYSIESGQFFVDVYMKVKPGTLDGTNITMQYNMMTEGENNSEDFTVLDPKDTSFDPETENILFASKKPIIFNVGDAQQICDDKFCFEMTMYDLNAELKTSVGGEVPYVSTLGKDYEMKFNLMNNNNVPLTNYRIIIENPQQNIHMTEGVVYSSDNNAYGLPEPNKFDDYFKYTFRPEVGKGKEVLYQNNVIKGDIFFTPIVEGTGSIKITIIEDKTIIYTREIYVSVVANKTLRVEIEPLIIPSYVPAKIKFTVYDANSGAFIDDAQVRIVDVYNTVLAENTTIESGVTYLGIDSQLPNIDLRLMVAKEGYKSFEMKLKTNDKFVEVSPETLKIIAVISDGYGTGTLTLKNTSELPVRIDTLKLEGNFDEYVSLRETNEYLAKSSLDKVIDKGQTVQMPVNVTLTTLGDQLQANKEYDAKLTLKIRPANIDSNDQKLWEFKIPVKLNLTLGEGLDSLDCLAIDIKKSELVSSNGKADQDTLTLTNGCTVNNKPVTLVNLEAKVNWKGNALGSFVFNRNENTARLQNAYYVTLNDSMIGHEEDSFIINFQPVTGRVSGATTAEVLIRAGYFAESGLQFVEQKVEYNVNVINMTSCISYVLPDNEVDLIKVPRDGKGNFTIKNDCDNAIDLKLNVLPDQFLDLRPLELSVPGKGEKQVLIDTKYSPVGIYLLEVRGKVPQQHFEGIKVGAEALRIFISPLESDCVVLDNYEFNLINDKNENVDRYTYVINKCYYKDIQSVYTLDVTPGSYWGGECTAANWEGFLASVMPATAGAMMTGNQIGKLLQPDDKWGLAGKELWSKDLPTGVKSGEWTDNGKYVYDKKSNTFYDDSGAVISNESKNYQDAVNSVHVPIKFKTNGTSSGKELELTWDMEKGTYVSTDGAYKNFTFSNDGQSYIDNDGTKWTLGDSRVYQKEESK